MKKINILLGAVLAGMAIGIGGTVYLSLDNKIIGSLMFTVGLYAICANGLYLFTGKVGYLVEQTPAYLGDLALIWLGNLIGTGVTGCAVNMTRVGTAIAEKSASLCAVKLGDGFLSLLILAVFCGMLMFIAVDGYKNAGNPLILFVCVSVFILCGFEHCIADMYYFSAAGMWSIKSLAVIIIITLGNALGGILIPLWKKTALKR